MEELIASHDLFVLQVEMDVYTMAKRVSTYTVAHTRAPIACHNIMCVCVCF